MKGHGTKFSRKMGEAATALLTQANVEAAARAAGISVATLMRGDRRTTDMIERAKVAAVFTSTVRNRRSL